MHPPIEITTPRSIIVKSTQIQYSQQVFLNFNTLTWPHVSVATLVPRSPSRSHSRPSPETARTGQGLKALCSRASRADVASPFDESTVPLFMCVIWSGMDADLNLARRLHPRRAQRRAFLAGIPVSASSRQQQEQLG